MLKSLSLAALLLACAVTAPVRAESVEDKAQVCMSCHGEKGVPIDKLVPVIWGQHQGYLYLQLRDYKLGNRTNEQMTAIVGDLEKADLMALAEYFSQKQWPNLGQPSASPEDTKRAETAIVSGQCGACHGETGLGSGTQPRINGQTHDYLLRTLTEFRTRERKNNPWMSDIMNALTEQDVASLAAYMAGR
ncbi:MAG: c-type cytochrome [Alsobacter sp.]